MSELLAVIVNLVNLVFLIFSFVIPAFNRGEIRGNLVAFSICALVCVLIILWLEHLRKIGIEAVAKRMTPPPDKSDIYYLNLPENSPSHRLAANKYGKKKADWAIQQDEDTQKAHKQYIGWETFLFIIGIGFTLVIAYNFAFVR